MPKGKESVCLDGSSDDDDLFYRVDGAESETLEELAHNLESLRDRVYSLPRIGTTLLFPTSESRERRVRDTFIISRPVWMSFVLSVQLHYPLVFVDLNPAHDIASDPPIPVYMSDKAIKFLNHMIGKFYGKDVEIYTVSTDPRDLRLLADDQNAVYLEPYRPVPGLQVIVTPTIQRSSDSGEMEILETKAKWGRGTLWSILKSGYQILTPFYSPHWE